MKVLMIGLVFWLSSAVSYANELEDFVLGDHVFTLQWLSDGGSVGKARIYKENEVVLVDAKHENKEAGFITMQGELQIIDRRELLFTGVIVSQVNYLNNNIPYTREGTFTLKATGKRKYWRMQDMTQPSDGSMAADYIDIYFEKFK